MGVVRKEAICYINAGSIIDVETLFKEIVDCSVDPERVAIHPRAAVITLENRIAERGVDASTTRTGSTQKGVGAAIADKIMRRAKLAEDVPELRKFVRRIDLNSALTGGKVVTVEVPQGYDLSINHGLSYPYCTSRDCWVGSGLSDAGIHPSLAGQTAMVVRTFPIRVGSVYNEKGELLGESGPFYPSSRELDWAKDLPGIEPERTTVTKRVRRIATWSNQQYRRACSFNRPTFVFLNFVNYFKDVRDDLERTPSELFYDWFRQVRSIETDLGLGPQHVFGTGPCVEQVINDVERTAQWLTK